MTNKFFLILAISFISFLSFGQNIEVGYFSEELTQKIDDKSDHYFSIAKKIWEFAEVGYQEVKSSNLLQEEMRRNGFSVETGVADIPTGFIASYGSGKPIIGIMPWKMVIGDLTERINFSVLNLYLRRKLGTNGKREFFTSAILVKGATKTRCFGLF